MASGDLLRLPPPSGLCCMAKVMYNAIQLIPMGARYHCLQCGHRWNRGKDRCPHCGAENWNEPDKPESIGGGICEICGCDFITDVGKDHFCPNCGSKKWDDGPNIRPPNLWIREVVKPSGKSYQYYMATWREGGETKNFHIGSVKRLSPEAARDKALKLKVARLSLTAV